MSVVVFSYLAGVLTPLAGSAEPLAAECTTWCELSARLERFVESDTSANAAADTSAAPADEWVDGLEAATGLALASEPLLEASIATVTAAEAAELAREASAEPDPFAPQVGGQRSAPHTWGPQYWISVGAHYVDGSYDKPNGFDYTESTAFSIDGGVYNWRGEMGIGLEAGLMSNSYELDGDAFGAGKGTIDVWRAMVGVRVADRGANDESYVPYARAGFMYRRDDGAGVLDDGVGWYAGLGLDWRIGDGIAFGPQVLYTSSQSQNSTEWIGGLLLTIGF